MNTSINEHKGTRHEHERTGRSKKLPYLDGFMDRRADSAAAGAGRKLTRRPRALNRISCCRRGEPCSEKLHLHFPDKSLLFLPKAIPAQRSCTCWLNALTRPARLRWYISVKARSSWLTLRNRQTDKDGAVPIRPKASNRVEHFWLCGPCAAQMTLTYDRQRGIEVVKKGVSKAPHSFRAAAS